MVGCCVRAARYFRSQPRNYSVVIVVRCCVARQCDVHAGRRRHNAGCSKVPGVLCPEGAAIDPTLLNELSQLGTVAGPLTLAGAGVFSEVWRCRIGGAAVVAKVPVEGPAGDAGRASGAYERELVAYTTLLPRLDVDHPGFVGAIRSDLGPVIVVEDLTGLRFGDQGTGVASGDAVWLAASLGRLHGSWSDAMTAQVRGPAPASHDRDLLERGFAKIATTWSARLDPPVAGAFERMAAGLDDEIERFVALDAVLTHGDPRAGNVAFRRDGTPCWYDWQQVSVQAPAADLAWLVSTSIGPQDRDVLLPPMLDAAGVPEAEYEIGLTHPATAVALLAGRAPRNADMAELVVNSLNRIGLALTAAGR